MFSGKLNSRYALSNIDTKKSNDKTTMNRSKTWQESAGRKDGKKGYMFGDMSRAVMKKAGSYTDDLQHVLEKPTCVFDRFFNTKTEPISAPRSGQSSASYSSDDSNTNASSVSPSSSHSSKLSSESSTSSSFLSSTTSNKRNEKKKGNDDNVIPPPKIVVKAVTSDVEKTDSDVEKTDTSTTTKVQDERSEEDEKDAVAVLAAMSNMCVLYRTHQKTSNLVKMILGNYDSVLLNDSFSTSDNVYALWGTSVLHDRTPPRLKYNRAEILLYSQVVEPVAGYHGMSRLTVTYQMKNQNLGVLEYVVLLVSLTPFLHTHNKQILELQTIRVESNHETGSAKRCSTVQGVAGDFDTTRRAGTHGSSSRGITHNTSSWCVRETQGETRKECGEFTKDQNLVLRKISLETCRCT